MYTKIRLCFSVTKNAHVFGIEKIVKLSEKKSIDISQPNGEK